MFKKILSTLTVSTELYQVEPLQHYIGYLARHCQVSDNKLFHIEILIEEIFTHIVSNAFNNRKDGEITVEVSATHANFVLQFHYMGIPFGYNMERIKDDQDEISLTLIQNLSSSYRMLQNGKNGQTVEICIALPSHINESLYSKPNVEKTIMLATDNVELREIRENEMEMLVQCLYNVFGYTYSAEGIYYPEVILERLHQGIYRGFVAVNEAHTVVAHVAMLKDSASSEICESGQAFVSPEYGKRGLFNHLKGNLIENAEKTGLRGVVSSAVTGHPFTQKANISLGCIETGLELGYIPADLKSVIPREGDEQRQAVMSYFYPTSHQKEMDIYVPTQHAEIIRKTYQNLGIKRNFMDIPEVDIFANDEAEVEMNVKTEWNQLHLIIKSVGKDITTRIRSIIRQVIVKNMAVAYLPLSLTDPNTPALVNILEKLGFYYSGIVPYECNGSDTIRMQYLVDTNISPKYIVAVSDWGEEIKNYVFQCKNKQDIISNSIF